MSALQVASRAIHYASLLLLLGELVFVFGVATPRDRTDLRARVMVVAGWSILASIASGIVWLAVEASVMSGLRLGDALSRETLALILGKTLFGRVWAVRLGLLVALGAALWAIRRSADHRSRLAIGVIVLAAANVAMLAAAGHAAGGGGLDGLIQIASDGVHLVAAGAWVGALPGFVFFLASARPLDVVAKITRRFSTLAVGSVGALVVSGFINAWYLVGDVPALFGTVYGRLLLAKLALFAAMATVAMVNRWYLIPRLARNDRTALYSLRRNAMIETAAGVVVVTIVGALGITVPAMHEIPEWPFAYTLSWQPAEQAGWIGAVLGAAAVIGCAAGCAVLGGLHSHQPRIWLAGLAGVAAAALAWALLLAVPAHPTTYAVSPVPYATDAIARGASVHAQNCSECHGGSGRGDGIGSRAPPLASSSRIDYSKYRYPGDLFWLIAHGIPGTAMPEFAPQLRDEDIWALIQFLRAQAEANTALALTDRVDPWRPIVAPDFTFEVAGNPQQSLRQPRESQQPSPALLVLYTLPGSRQRLKALATNENTFTKAGMRVIALPLDPLSTPAENGGSEGKWMLAIARPNVAATYAMFARRSTEATSDAPRHVEFLVDRLGYLRARWSGVPDAASNQTADILGQVEVLNREPPGDPTKGPGH
jgi:putative copper resistance protein D